MAQELTITGVTESLGIPYIEGEITQHAGTVIDVAPANIGKYSALLGAGSLALVDAIAGKALIRLGESDTWLLVQDESKRVALHETALSDLGGLEGMGFDPSDFEGLDEDGGQFKALDTQPAFIAASAIAQAPGFASVYKNPRFRDDFALPFVKKHYPATASGLTDWHVMEIAARAKTLWEYAVLPRDAKLLHASGMAMKAIAAKLGVGPAKAKWAVELQPPYSMEHLLK